MNQEREPHNPELEDIRTAILLIAVAVIYYLNKADMSAIDRTQLKFLIGGVALLQYLPVDHLYQEAKKYLATALSLQPTDIQDNPVTGDD